MDKKIFSKPKHGWVLINIGEFKGWASYITDVPIDCIKAMKHALVAKTDFVCCFDSEADGTFKIVSDEYRTFVIEEAETNRLYVCEDITKQDLANAFVNELTEDIWGDWIYSDEDEEIMKTQYIDELNEERQKLQMILAG